MSVHVTIIHGAGSEQSKHEWTLPALPRAGDHIFLENHKSGEVRRVEFVLADEYGDVQMPKILVRLI